jgi:hypothetical protein
VLKRGCRCQKEVIGVKKRLRRPDNQGAINAKIRKQMLRSVPASQGAEMRSLPSKAEGFQTPASSKDLPAYGTLGTIVKNRTWPVRLLCLSKSEDDWNREIFFVE